MIYIVMLAIVACILTIGCKKEINFNAFPDPHLIPNNEGKCRLTILKVDAGELGTSILNFSYDNLGRLAKTTSGSKILTYTYSLNKVSSKNQDGESAEIILLNGFTLASATGVRATSTGVNYAATKHYTYNEFGYLIQISSFIDGELVLNEDLAYFNGNLSKCTASYIGTNRVETITYTYSTELAGETYQMADPLSFHVDYFTGGYFGKTSKNILVKTSKIIKDGANQISDITSTFTYNYDQKGNMNSLVVLSETNLNQGTEAPIYNEVTTKYDLVYTCN